MVEKRQFALGDTVYSVNNSVSLNSKHYIEDFSRLCALTSAPSIRRTSEERGSRAKQRIGGNQTVVQKTQKRYSFSFTVSQYGSVYESTVKK